MKQEEEKKSEASRCVCVCVFSFTLELSAMEAIAGGGVQLVGGRLERDDR